MVSYDLSRGSWFHMIYLPVYVSLSLDNSVSRILFPMMHQKVNYTLLS